MEEYIGLEIEDFGIYLRFPEWWQHRLEEDGTYLFWDEYVGSFRITPILQKEAKFLMKIYLNDLLESNVGSKLEQMGRLHFVQYKVDNQQSDGHVTRSHFYIGGKDRVLLVCSFAYDIALLEDEFNADGVAAALDEVEILLEGLSFGDDD